MIYVTGSGSSWDLRDYMKYLDENKKLMDQSVIKFAMDPAQFSLRHPNSLHDSNVEEIRISEFGNNHHNNSLVSIEISLVGQSCDRAIKLSYKDVCAYSIDRPREYQLPPYGAGHGDVIVHEMTMSDDFSYRHELFLSSGARIIINFKEFSHEIKLR